MNTPDLSNIQCAVCGHRVERVDAEWNPTSDQFTYTVHCHGDLESTTVGRAWLTNGTRLESGVAFATARLGVVHR